MSFLTGFLILLVAVFAIVVYFTEPSKADVQVRERLAAVRRHVSEKADEDSDILIREVKYSTIGFINRFLRRTKAASRLQSVLDQAQVPWTVGKFVFYSLLLVVFGATAGNWRFPGIVGWLPGMLLGSLPSLWIYYKRQARFRRFEAMLPEAIDLMTRVLRSGHALPSALVMVADEIPDPVGTEFRRTADELSYGLPFREAMLNMERRFPIDELRFLVTAIVVQKESGGNLVDLLEKSAGLLRARIVLRQKIRVFSAQGRMTGWILGALPFVAFLALNYVRPGYSQPLFEEGIGRTLVYMALAAMAVGVFLIRKIVNIKV
jgi:tight adherence protein B